MVCVNISRFHRAAVSSIRLIRVIISAQSYNTTYLPVSIVKTPLIESYLTTQDARSFVILLGAISDGMLMRERDTTDEAEIGEEVDPIGRLDFCGAMIRKLVRCLDREGRVYELETILKVNNLVVFHLMVFLCRPPPPSNIDGIDSIPGNEQ